jgi:pimeloyl-ACP methyl ester carboxylesterase
MTTASLATTSYRKAFVVEITERTASFDNDLKLTFREAGQGESVLVLHGGAGPASVTPIVARLARTHHVLAPTHPGWDSTVRPNRLSTVAQLAKTYLELLERLGLRGTTVLGSSFGGWVAAEMSTRAVPAGPSRLILLDAIGPKPQHARPAPATPASSPDPAAAPQTPPGRGPSPADLALIQAYTGPTMFDPDLRERLTSVRLPTLVLWGEQDPVVPVAYGRDYAGAFPDSRFVVIPDAGHLPASQAPEPTFAAIDDFLTGSTTTTAQTA